MGEKVKIVGLKKHFDDLVVLDGIDLTVEEGEVVHHARIVIRSLNDDNSKLSAFERFKLRNKLTIYVDNVVETEE